MIRVFHRPLMLEKSGFPYPSRAYPSADRTKTSPYPSGYIRPWAQRSIRTHTNAVETLIIFAVLVLVLEMTGPENGLTATATKLHFISRVVHFAVYRFGVSWLRTPVYLFGFGCPMAIAWTV
ncbi:MAG: hypothetical protein COB39_14325 [Marinosulfonomonas sp.]|nr:MAG: hypothetical protein COB39_14325 [Marinosulfonomonas sp.]